MARELTGQEQQIVESTLDQLAAYYAVHADEAKLLIGVGATEADASIPADELAAWTMTVNELMNLDEVLNK